MKFPLISELKFHPPGLRYLFAAEMWERFSFYGMRSILMLYLIQQLHMAREEASLVYASYTSLVYLTPLIGGQIADQILGRNRAVMVGAITMSLGHFAMSFEALLYFGLGMLVVGNGFFKPNISCQVGELYQKNDSRHSRAYLLFYAGINLGAMFSPLVCGTLGQNISWHLGFAAAGVGMIAGMLTYYHGRKYFPTSRASLDSSGETWTKLDFISIAKWSVGASLFVLFALQFSKLYSPDLSPLMLFAYRLGFVAVVTLILAKIVAIVSVGSKVEKSANISLMEQRRVISLLLMTMFIVVFFMAFEQAGNSMALFAENQTRCQFFGYKFPSSWFQAANPLFVLLFTWASAWISWGSKLSNFRKQALGLFILGIGCFLMCLAEVASSDSNLVSPLWLIFVFAIFTSAELLVSPNGLALVQKIAPPSMLSLMMGLAYVGVYAGNYLAGSLASILKDSLGVSTSIGLWVFLGLASMLAAMVYLAVIPVMRKLSQCEG